jgi:hypothetical protein
MGEGSTARVSISDNTVSKASGKGSGTPAGDCDLGLPNVPVGDTGLEIGDAGFEDV